MEVKNDDLWKIAVFSLQTKYFIVLMCSSDFWPKYISERLWSYLKKQVLEPKRAIFIPPAPCLKLQSGTWEMLFHSSFMKRFAPQFSVLSQHWGFRVPYGFLWTDPCPDIQNSVDILSNGAMANILSQIPLPLSLCTHPWGASDPNQILPYGCVMISYSS